MMGDGTGGRCMNVWWYCWPCARTERRVRWKVQSVLLREHREAPHDPPKCGCNALMTMLPVAEHVMSAIHNLGGDVAVDAVVAQHVDALVAAKVVPQ